MRWKIWLGAVALGGMSLWVSSVTATRIEAGIRTAAVINVGTATIAAFIGAGGYGERIVAGLAVNDNAMLLAGALPATAMALVIEGLFGWLILETIHR